MAPRIDNAFSLSRSRLLYFAELERASFIWLMVRVQQIQGIDGVVLNEMTSGQPDRFACNEFIANPSDRPMICSTIADAYFCLRKNLAEGTDKHTRTKIFLRRSRRRTVNPFVIEFVSDEKSL